MVNSKVIIWRVEDCSGKGPYRDAKYLIGPLAEHSCANGRPNLWSDNLDVNLSYYCGFRSRSQMRRWFRLKDWRWLWSQGFKVVTYTISKRWVRYGSKQVTFRKSKAKKVDIGRLTIV